MAAQRRDRAAGPQPIRPSAAISGHVAGRSFHRHKDLYSAADVGRHVQQPHGLLRPDFLADPRQCRPIWWEWQTRNPNSLPADLDAVLSPWSYTVRDMLDISRFGYEYVRSAFFMPVGMEAPIARFVSKPIKPFRPQAQAPLARPRSGCTGCRSSSAPASFALSSIGRAPTPRPHCETIRTMRAISPSSDMANVTAGRAIATCRRPAPALSTIGRAATTPRATTAST